jgi:hypothetical protein
MNSPSLHNSIRKVCALVAATLILPALASLSFSALAAEKKKVMGTNKWGPPICRTVVPLGPGDDPKHELVVQAIYRATTTSSDPDINETEITTMSRVTQWREPDPIGDILYGIIKMEIQTTGHTKDHLKQRSKKMVLGKQRRGRGPGR